MEQMSVIPGVFVAAGGGPVVLPCGATHHLFIGGKKQDVSAVIFEATLMLQVYVLPYASSAYGISCQNGTKTCESEMWSGTVGSPRRPREARPRHVPVRCQKQLLHQHAGQYLPSSQTPPAGSADRNFTGFTRN